MITSVRNVAIYGRSVDPPEDCSLHFFFFISLVLFPGLQACFSFSKAKLSCFLGGLPGGPWCSDGVVGGAGAGPGAGPSAAARAPCSSLCS